MIRRLDTPFQQTREVVAHWSTIKEEDGHTKVHAYFRLTENDSLSLICTAEDTRQLIAHLRKAHGQAAKAMKADEARKAGGTNEVR